MKNLEKRLGDLERRMPKPPAGGGVLVYLPTNERDGRPPGRYGNVVIYDPEETARMAIAVAEILEECGALDICEGGPAVKAALAEARSELGGAV